MSEQVNDAGEVTGSSIEDTLNERGDRYGSFKSHAELSQALSQTILQHYFTHHVNPQPLPPYMIESIQRICHKLARIANGDPHYVENWQAISTYSNLVSEELQTGTDTPT